MNNVSFRLGLVITILFFIAKLVAEDKELKVEIDRLSTNVLFSHDKTQPTPVRVN